MIEHAQLQELEWLAKNTTTTDAQASALSGLAVLGAIEQFETSSDKVGQRMLRLTWVLVILTVVLVVLTVFLIGSPQIRGV